MRSEARVEKEKKSNSLLSFFGFGDKPKDENDYLRELKKKDDTILKLQQEIQELKLKLNK